MNTFVIETWDDECEFCTFYTVRWDDAEVSETNKFYEKFINDPNYTDDLNALTSLIVNKIGNEYGAIDELFNRAENEATALPPKGRVRVDGLELLYFPQFPLRLFTLRVTENIVILLNGGVKDAATAQDSSLSMQWNEATVFAKKILDAIAEGMIDVDEANAQLLWYTGSKEIII